MRKTFHRRPMATPQRRYRINDAIIADEVRVIGPAGEHFGVIPFAEARAKAQELELDLIEVEPTANPPVCKIIDFGKFQYEQEKQKRKAKAKQKKTETKGIRLSLRIGTHDLEVRQEQAKGFLDEGDDVKLELVLRGRERQHTQLAMDIIKNFVDTLRAAYGPALAADSRITVQGGRLGTMITLKKTV